LQSKWDRCNCRAALSVVERGATAPMWLAKKAVGLEHARDALASRFVSRDAVDRFPSRCTVPVQPAESP